MCKWSVRSGHSIVDVKLLSAPWNNKSYEVRAIALYAYRYTQSFNYDNSDIMTDYFDKNFYGTYSPNNIISYCDYEETENSREISELFMQKKEEFDKAEQKRLEIEFAEEEKKREEQRKEQEKLEKIRKENLEKIESQVVVEDVEGFFITNLLSASINKLDSVHEYMERLSEDASRTDRVDAKVTRKVFMDNETYELFSNQLLDDFSFLEKMGGSNTEDNRLQSITDWNMMSKEERETVKWYSDKCVGIYADNELKMVVDPQGYSYARYVFFPDSETENSTTYTIDQVVSDDEAAAYKVQAEILADESSNIIEKNDMLETWNTDRFTEYKEKMKEVIINKKLKFNINAVRQIEIENLKKAMYELLSETNGIQEQFKRAGFEENQKITIVQTGSLGGISSTHVKFKSFSCERYAQYDNAVKVVCRPERKRRDHYGYFYGDDILVYDGWLDIPENILYIVEDHGEWTTKRSKYSSFDKRALDDVMEYFSSKGIKPLVNTYKPA